MGLRDKYTKKIEEQGFQPLELTEGNVQAIFNRCLAKEGTPDDKCFKSILFSRLGGYSPDAERIVVFDKEKVQANKKNICYLYGQLKDAHERNSSFLQINEAFYSYLGRCWTTSKGILLEFLYLGAINDECPLLSAFSRNTNSAILNTDVILPTLSPKGPAFPAWWEAHKAEWEQ